MSEHDSGRLQSKSRTGGSIRIPGINPEIPSRMEFCVVFGVYNYFCAIFLIIPALIGKFKDVRKYAGLYSVKLLFCAKVINLEI
jgi:hypothetical protein